MTRMLLPVAGVLLLFGVAACKTSSTTRLSQSFRNPGFEETVFKELFVIGVAADPESRKAFEDAFVAAIVKRGGGAHASWNTLPESTLLSEEQIENAIQSQRSDGILITRLLSVDTQNTNYTPPKRFNRPRKTLAFVPGGGWDMQFGGFHTFYASTFTEVHRPGYFDTSKTVVLETYLYSVATKDLVWTAQTETVDPRSVNDLLSSMTATIAKTLDKQRLIP